MTLGGGGGAGQGDDVYGTGGAAGGGALWLRAASIEGNGRIDAEGAPGPRALSSPTASGDGAGGGGGGGLVSIASKQGLRCAEISARGGAGGTNVASVRGPGGGGGGGYVQLRGPVLSCPVQVEGGAAGLANGSNYGASPGGMGLVRQSF